MKPQATTIPNPAAAEEKWYVVDAAGQVLGRVASRVASLVRGKRNVDFSPHLNPRIHVVIVNADKVVLTGAKLKDKTYYHHSGWRTGIKAITAEKLLQKNPSDVLRFAIHGMLPKNTLGSALRKNIRIYAGSEHPHEAQQPESLVIKTRQPKAKA